MEVKNGFFNGRVPLATTANFDIRYHLDFMRYLYYMCIMHAEGKYPNELSLEVIEKAFNNKQRKCIPIINKILICETPPTNYANYFYNSGSGAWNTKTGKPSRGQGYTSAIKNALFPYTCFPDKVSFLKACANNGFLLLDLFPYAIKISGTERNTKAYKTACYCAFGAAIGTTKKYPINIIDTLDKIKCYIDVDIAVGFGLFQFGNIILSDRNCVKDFSAWLTTNRKRLNPVGAIDVAKKTPKTGESTFLRVCGKNNGSQAPVASLLQSAGIL